MISEDQCDTENFSNGSKKKKISFATGINYILKSQWYQNGSFLAFSM